MTSIQPIQQNVLALLVVAPLLVYSTGCSSSAQAEAQMSDEEVTKAETLASRLEGIDIGAFSVREVHPLEGLKSKLDFVLVASVRHADADVVQQVLTARQYKIRDQIITAARVAPLEEFSEPGLDMLRKRMILRLRRAIPEFAVQDLLITEFTYSLDKL